MTGITANRSNMFSLIIRLMSFLAASRDRIRSIGFIDRA